MDSTEQFPKAHHHCHSGWFYNCPRHLFTLLLIINSLINNCNGHCRYSCYYHFYVQHTQLAAGGVFIVTTVYFPLIFFLSLEDSVETLCTVKQYCSQDMFRFHFYFYHFQPIFYFLLTVFRASTIVVTVYTLFFDHNFLIFLLKPSYHVSFSSSILTFCCQQGKGSIVRHDFFPLVYQCNIGFLVFDSMITLDHEVPKGTNSYFLLNTFAHLHPIFVLPNPNFLQPD